MSFAAWIVNSSIRAFINITCKIDRDELLKVPMEGPFILVSNHVTSLEVPLFYSFLQPGKITGFAKAEFWNKPLFRLLLNKIRNAIPIHRGTVDLKAFRLALHDNVPILPITHYGRERLKQNLTRFHRTDFYIKVGKPFKFRTRIIR